MWVRRRRRRWFLLGVGGAIYLALLIWLLSPLWGSPSQPRRSRTPVHRLAVQPRLRVAHLQADAAVPSVLPGSSTGDGTGAGDTGETAGSESTYTETTPEPEIVEEAAASPTQATAPDTGGGGSGGGESKTVIGFEG
jgi:hypothetical protein